MSNLIKSVYFNVDPSEVRVIDSDEKVEEFIPDIFEKPQTAQEYSFQDLEAAQIDDADAELTPFEDGISVIHMDDVVSQEREKLEQQLREDQEKILEEAQKTVDEMIADAQSQVDSIKESAYSEGIAQGLEEGRIQASQELETMKLELQKEYDQRFHELDEQEKGLEPAFAELVVSLVRKLTGVVCEDKKNVILYLIGNSMKNLERTNKLVLRISKTDISRVAAKKDTFKAIARGVSEFEIVEDDSLSQNQCIIETDNKVIDCSLDAQLQNLEEHVKMLVY